MKHYTCNGCMYLDFKSAKNKMYETILYVIRSKIMEINCPKYGHKPMSILTINTLLQLIKNDNYDEMLTFIEDIIDELNLHYLVVVESEPNKCEKPIKLLNKLLNDIKPLLKEEVFK